MQSSFSYACNKAFTKAPLAATSSKALHTSRLLPLDRAHPLWRNLVQLQSDVGLSVWCMAIASTQCKLMATSYVRVEKFNPQGTNWANGRKVFNGQILWQCFDAVAFGSRIDSLSGNLAAVISPAEPNSTPLLLASSALACTFSRLWILPLRGLDKPTARECWGRTMLEVMLLAHIEGSRPLMNLAKIQIKP